MKKIFLFLSAMMLATHVQAEGVVIGGVRWATANVESAGKFADAPEADGGHFTFEEAQRACPEGWRLPTIEEFHILWISGSTWTKLGKSNGRMFGAGAGDDLVFLPAARSLSPHKTRGGTYNYAASRRDFGGYWSSTRASGNINYILSFDKGSVSRHGRGSLLNKFSVRCVFAGE